MPRRARRLADFERQGVRADPGGIDELADEVVVDQEVLAEALARRKAAVGEELLDFGEGLQPKASTVPPTVARHGRCRNTEKRGRPLAGSTP
jgi:hypothetical protein